MADEREADKPIPQVTRHRFIAHLQALGWSRDAALKEAERWFDITGEAQKMSDELRHLNSRNVTRSRAGR
jgi:hypothetical protein